jgi:ADP-heptose:LPS heptosyltransferase
MAQGARIGFIPGSTNAFRVIPPKKGAEIQAKLNEPIALIGAASERDFADRLLENLPDGVAVDLVGKLSLRESMAVIASLNVVIGPDSGLIHVSAGLGTPTVTTFSFSQAEKWGHYYDPHTVLRTGENMSGDDVVDAARRHL